MSAAKKMGSDLESILGGNDEQQGVEIWLDTGFAPLNDAISGDFDRGLPCGRVVEMFGGSSCGKTAIATMVMAAAQRAGGIAGFADHEHSFMAELGVDLGLRVDKQWVYKRPRTFEESIDQAVKVARTVRERKMIPDTAPIVWVFDSLASMVPQSKLKDAKTGEDRGSESYGMHDNMALAKCTSASFPALNQFAAESNMLLLFLNQTRTKPGVSYGDPTTTPGGNAPEFYASVRISLTRAMLREKGAAGADGKAKPGPIVGQDITANIKKNKVSRPFLTASWRFMFREDGTGYFDVIYSTLEYMKAKGMLELDGKYIVWEGKKLHLVQVAKLVEAEGVGDTKLRQIMRDFRAAKTAVKKVA